ncbi:MAG: dicarboxylate/amino acid:cation symporter [Tenacibaculum sp.]|nr:dicarboxylate/amino acid:cation symporter [Tenacibaculum sp.]
MKKLKLGLLPKIIIAIVLGILCSYFFPENIVRVFATFNGLFGNFLGFIIPLIILGLVAPSIADLGKGAGKLLIITALLAYGFTIFSGFSTYLTCELVYPFILSDSDKLVEVTNKGRDFTPFFTVQMKPLMEVMTALILAFTLGLGIATTKSESLKKGLDNFKKIIDKIIASVIIPILPLYIYGIFLLMGSSGQVGSVIGVFLKIIVIIFFITVVLLFVQFSIAGLFSKKNPLRLLKNMLPAYMTALGTQSSAATIPVTLEQTIKNDVKEEVADFVIPLCATIHLSGSTMKIVACSMAIMVMSGMPIEFEQMAGFILMLGVTMVAAPGVPGGAIMAALGLLSSMLGFDETIQGLMIALYIAMDSFGTATNVTGDGAIAVIINRIRRII